MRTPKRLNRRRFLGASPTALGILAGLDAAAAGVAADPPLGSGKPRDAAARALERLEQGDPRMLNVSPMEGQFLNLLVRMTRARRVLEIGTSFGYSALWIASGLAETGDGRLITIDINPDRVQAARRHVAEAELTGRITFEEGDAHAIVRRLEGPFDLVFVDADKDGLVDYFRALHPAKLGPAAVILAHEVLRMREWMLDYLELLQQHPQYDSVILTAAAEEGLLLSLRRASTDAP